MTDPQIALSARKNELMALVPMPRLKLALRVLRAEEALAALKQDHQRALARAARQHTGSHAITVEARNLSQSVTASDRARARLLGVMERRLRDARASEYATKERLRAVRLRRGETFGEVEHAAKEAAKRAHIEWDGQSWAQLFQVLSRALEHWPGSGFAKTLNTDDYQRTSLWMAQAPASKRRVTHVTSTVVPVTSEGPRWDSHDVPSHHGMPDVMPAPGDRRHAIEDVLRAEREEAIAASGLPVTPMARNLAAIVRELRRSADEAHERTRMVEARLTESLTAIAEACGAALSFPAILERVRQLAAMGALARDAAIDVQALQADKAALRVQVDQAAQRVAGAEGMSADALLAMGRVQRLSAEVAELQARASKALEVLQWAGQWPMSMDDYVARATAIRERLSSDSKVTKPIPI